ncbi:MAG: hypothetical protein ACM3PU_08060 [Gemmatimonadota bacterium]
METFDAKRRDALRMLAAAGFAVGAAGYARAKSADASVAPGVDANLPDGIVFDNAQARVLRRTAAPGQPAFGTLPSDAPNLVLFMIDAEVAATGARVKPARYRQGALLWNPADAGALNAGARATTVYVVLPKAGAPGAAPTPDARGSAPNTGGKVMLDNAWVRVIQHSARPRMGVCGMGMHTHPPHLTIGLRDGRIKVIEPNVDPVIRDVKAGAVFWDAGGLHAIENLASRDSLAFLIEFKQA